MLFCETNFLGIFIKIYQTTIQVIFEISYIFLTITAIGITIFR